MEERTTLALDCKGVLYPQSQTEDYRLRGVELENYNVLDFFVDTYEEATRTRNNKPGRDAEHDAVELRG